MKCKGGLHRPHCAHCTMAPYYRCEEEAYLCTRVLLLLKDGDPNVNASAITLPSSLERSFADIKEQEIGWWQQMHISESGCKCKILRTLLFIRTLLYSSSCNSKCRVTFFLASCDQGKSIDILTPLSVFQHRQKHPLGEPLSWRQTDNNSHGYPSFLKT